MWVVCDLEVCSMAYLEWCGFREENVMIFALILFFAFYASCMSDICVRTSVQRQVSGSEVGISDESGTSVQ